MKRLALEFYSNGFNCSQAILKAVSKKFDIKLSNECINLCTGVNNGFGIQSICSVLVACIMSLGLFFDDQTTKKLRIKFLNEFNLKYKSLNCERLSEKYSCKKIISDAADIIEKIILDARSSIQRSKKLN